MRANDVSGDAGAFSVSFPDSGEYRVYVFSNQHEIPSLVDRDYLKAHAEDYPLVRIVDGENPAIVLRMPPAHDRR